MSFFFFFFFHHQTMPLQSCKSGNTIMFLEKALSVQKPNKRLRKAFRVIYFVVSLAKKVIANGKNTQFLPRFLPGPSYVAIDIQAIDDDDDNHDHKPLFDIDQKTLSEIVREKNFNSLCQYGGVKEVAAILETDMKVVVVVSAISNFMQSRQFDKLSDESSDLMKVEVVGLLVAFLVLIVLLIRYFTGNTEDEHGNQEFNRSKTKANDVMHAVVRIVAAAVTIVVVAIPEGLPLAVTLTLAYSMKRMMVENSMVRKLSACETMGSAATICTDKTGTLTLNQMKVTEFWPGKEVMTDKASLKIAPNVLEMLHEGVGLNTTGEVYRQLSTSIPEISGSPTESAILSWVVFDLAMDIDELKQGHEILQVEAFNSEKKRSGVLTRMNGKKIHAHWKGAAKMILSMCSYYYTKNRNIIPMNDEERTQFEMIIKDMAAKSLRCIAFGYKEVTDESVEVSRKIEETGLTLLGLVGLKDPSQPGVRAAVQACRDAGVDVKMITGDNIFTAKAIAIESGIVKPNEDSNNVVVEGVTFRNYSDEERMEKINTIRVMARSSPFDKLLMEKCLKRKGHVVAVTGDGTNDAPALKEADIGLSMGIQGTEVAKESSDIVILDDNFTSVVTVLKWGRCVYNNIQKFIQFQLTVNVAALVVNFVLAISFGEVPLTAIQLL
ncbi:hypothetical protein ACSBR2_005184 [Camellia fascicularis]